VRSFLVVGLVSGVFISYRRQDSDIAAGRLAENLSDVFGPASVFRDIDNIDPGADYEVTLERVLDSCTVLLALIGPRWSSISDEGGYRRLDDPTDWVRAEISRALVRGIRVIPILISGASMPLENELPAELSALAKRQALELDDRHWEAGFVAAI
jgi:TIR domain